MPGDAGVTMPAGAASTMATSGICVVEDCGGVLM